MSRTQKGFLSTVLIILAVSLILYSPPLHKITETDTTTLDNGDTHSKEVEHYEPSKYKYIDWFIIALLVYAVWLWRKELGIGQLGPIGAASDPVTQQSPGGPPKPPEDSEPVKAIDLSALSTEMRDKENRQRLEYIMQMFNETHSIDAFTVSRKLNVARNTAESLLFLLTKNGKLRADGFPRKTIYTPAQSIENRILDRVRDKLKESEDIFNERRYIRYKTGYEIDALFESKDVTYVVEAKIIRDNNVLTHLEGWINRLIKVADQFRPIKVVCILAIGCIDGADFATIKMRLAAITTDTGSAPVQILVFSKAKLRR